MKHAIHYIVALTCLAGLVLGCSAKSPDARSKLESEGIEGARGGLPGDSQAEPASAKPELDPPLPTLEEPHFAAFDLLVNRPLAHRVRFDEGGPSLVVDASTPDFVRYIHGGHSGDWMLDHTIDDRGVAAIEARTASIWLPAFEPDSTDVIRLHIYNPAKWDNTLKVKLNGQPLAPAKLGEGWQTIEVASAGALKSENAVDLTFSNLGRVDGKLSGGAIAGVEIGPPSAEDPVAVQPSSEKAEDGAGSGAAQEAAPKAEEPAAGSGTSAGGDRQPEKPAGAADIALSGLPMGQGELELDEGEAAAWYVWIVDDAKLDLEITAPETCGAEVVLEGDKDGETVELMREARTLVKGRGTAQTTAVDLSEHSGQVGRLTLRAADGCAEPVVIERAQLVVAGEVPTVPDDVEPPKYVIFWMIDTLRADYLPLHYDTDVQTPELQRLANDGASFRVAYVQGNESKTSHASLFAGMYPSKHGVVGRGSLGRSLEILPEAMANAGYKTGAHVSNGYVSHPWGFVQGWDHYVNNLRDGWRIDGHSMAEHGAKWAKKNKDDKFFLYLGTIDPHVTYRRHKDLIERYYPEPYTGKYRSYLSGEELGKIKGGGVKVSEEDKKRIVALYKNEIEFNDQALGKLRKALEEAGMWDETMIVVTSDHGEEFWEHGSVGHGHNIHQELVHVPVLLYYPPLIPENTVVDAGIDVLDLYPTILDAVGGETPEEVQGKSAIPLVHNVHGGYPEPTIATQYRIHYAMQMQDFKLYLKRGEYELFERKSDSLEMKNVAGDHPLASRWLLDSMGWFRAHRKAWDKRTWGVPNKVAPGFVERVEGRE
ncbi:MAG: sulfatase [Myxococcota bacterium]